MCFIFGKSLVVCLGWCIFGSSLTLKHTTMKNQDTLISTTAIINGWGPSKYKSVTHLTSEERTHIRNGGLVLVPYLPTSPMQSGWKQVYAYGGKFYHKEATPEQIATVV